MEKLIELGKTRAIGVSNFNIEKVDRLLKNCKIPPAVNQVIIILRLIVYIYQF
jgi:diketogulonate reductase-like aldo/keto reductase